MDFFVWHPSRVAIVAAAFVLISAAFAVLGRFNGRFRSWPFFAAAALWVLYAFWEWLAREKRWNIRVDLFLIYPILLAASIAAPALSYRWKRPRG